MIGQDQVEKGIMFTEADRVELHNAVTAEMGDLADKASKGYVFRVFDRPLIKYCQTECFILPRRSFDSTEGRVWLFRTGQQKLPLRWL